MRRPWPFAGRKRELAVVRATLQDPRASGLVLAGPAGVGKSRLVREVVRAWGDRSHAVQVLANRVLADVPFGAIAHLIRPGPPDAAWNAQPIRWAIDQLVAAAGGRRLVLAVDDAQHLDRASAAVVAQLVRHSTAFLLATVRTGEPVPEPISALWVEEVVDRLDVSAPDADETVDILTGALGGPVEEFTARRLVRLSQGNLLLLREVVIAGIGNGNLAQVHGSWRWTGSLTITPRLTDVVLSRLGGLADDERQSLEVVAFGEPVGLQIAAELGSSTAVESLEARGLVVLRQDGRRTDVLLAHPLYGEVVRARCPVLRSRRVQRQLAEAVEATGAKRHGDVLRISLWRLESGTAADPERLLDACRHAWAAHDVGLACRIARAALDAGGGVPAALLLSEVLNWAERYQESADVLGSVADMPMTDQQRLAFAAARAQVLFFGLHEIDEASAALGAAKATVADPHVRRQLASLIANHAFWSGACDDALRWSQQLLREPSKSAGVEATVLADAALSFSHSGMSDEALAAVGNARRISSTWVRDFPLIELILDTAGHYANLFAGRLDAAERMATELVERISVDGYGGWDMAMAAGELLCAQVARFRGKLDMASSLSRAGAASGTGSQGLLRSTCLGEAAHAAALMGNATEAKELLAQADRQWTPSVRPLQYWVDLARPWVSAADGRTGDAVAEALRTADHASGKGFVGFEVLALHDVVRLGQARLVTRRLSVLESQVDGELTPICAEHARAATARSGTALERVADGFERLGIVLYAAEARAHASAAHAASGAARAARRSAVRALALVDRCAGARTVALKTLRTPGLTTREREVAELAASGQTSAAIASRLVLSPRTVENHLQRAFAKLGVTRRDQLKNFFPPRSE